MRVIPWGGPPGREWRNPKTTIALCPSFESTGEPIGSLILDGSGHEDLTCPRKHKTLSSGLLDSPNDLCTPWRFLATVQEFFRRAVHSVLLTTHVTSEPLETKTTTTEWGLVAEVRGVLPQVIEHWGPTLKKSPLTKGSKLLRTSRNFVPNSWILVVLNPPTAAQIPSQQWNCR